MSVVSRLNKLRAMSAGELSGRVAAASYRFYERRTISVGGGERSSPTLVSTESPQTAFLPSVQDLERTRQILTTRFGAESAETLARADCLLAGEARLFGRSVPVPFDVEWNRDPVSGGRWPLVYHRDVPIGDRQRSPGDPKDVWELNRHQFLIDLGKAWLLTGDERYFALADRHISSWLEQNPYGFGINWAGPLEVAYRALSWVWLYRMAPARIHSDAPLHARWLGGIEKHGRFLHRHLELFESPYNHLVGESAVLFVLGTLFPQFAEAERWRLRGQRLLEERLPEQFHADGGSVEQASGYHHATLGYYLLAACVARSNGRELSPAVWQAIERAIEFSMLMQQPDGLQPALGDNDDARPFAFEVQSTWDYRHFQAAGASLFGRGDFKASADSRFREDAFWLLGPEGVDAFDRLPAAAPSRVSCVLENSGYVILRSDWAEQADYVCFDCGPQAGGLRTDDVPSAAHGHADALSIVAHLAGAPLLVDSGFYCYDGERAWERHFRETAAHNTVRIDGKDQALHLEKMAWSRVPTVQQLGAGLTPGEAWAAAAHDGYARDGITHRRSVYLRHRYLVICDEISGTGTHDVEVLFQFDAGLAVSPQPNRLALGDRFELAWLATAPLTATFACGGDDPDQGWIAPRLGQRTPAPRLALGARVASGLKVVTILTDRRVWTLETSAPGSRPLVFTAASADRVETIAPANGVALTFHVATR